MAKPPEKPQNTPNPPPGSPVFPRQNHPATNSTIGGLSTSLAVGLGILVLIVILIAALLLRPRKKKT